MLGGELLDRAKSAYDSGDYAEALRRCRTCLKTQGDYFEPGDLGFVHRMIGDCLMNAGNFWEATSAYEKALQDGAYGHRASVRIGYGVALYSMGEHESAVRQFRAALRDPNFAAPYEAYLGLGNAYMLMGDLASAGAAFRNAAIDKHNPSPARALLGLGECFSGLGRLDDAADTYRAIVELRPDRETLEKAYEGMKRVRKAGAVARLARVPDPSADNGSARTAGRPEQTPSANGASAGTDGQPERAARTAGETGRPESTAGTASASGQTERAARDGNISPSPSAETPASNDRSKPSPNAESATHADESESTAAAGRWSKRLARAARARRTFRRFRSTATNEPAGTPATPSRDSRNDSGEPADTATTQRDARYSRSDSNQSADTATPPLRDNRSEQSPNADAPAINSRAATPDIALPSHDNLIEDSVTVAAPYGARHEKPRVRVGRHLRGSLRKAAAARRRATEPEDTAARRDAEAGASTRTGEDAVEDPIESMTDVELRSLTRVELLELLLDQVEDNGRLRRQLVEAHAALDDRRITVERAGSMAEAALRLSGVFEAADEAAKQYMENVRLAALKGGARR